MLAELPPLTQLRTRAAEFAGVWHLSLPISPWKRSSAERERILVIDRITAALPLRILWLSDLAGEGKAGWHRLSAGEALSRFKDDLLDGGWGLFFFSAHSTVTIDLDRIPVGPTSADAALRTLQDLQARAGIWSRVDNNEWLVAMRREEP